MKRQLFLFTESNGYPVMNKIKLKIECIVWLAKITFSRKEKKMLPMPSQTGGITGAIFLTEMQFLNT